MMSDDTFLYREEQGEIEESQELNQDQIKTIISHAPTSDLVAELVKREGVKSIPCSTDEFYRISIGNYTAVDFNMVAFKEGPACIIVVREDEQG